MLQPHRPHTSAVQSSCLVVLEELLGCPLLGGVGDAEVGSCVVPAPTGSTNSSVAAGKAFLVPCTNTALWKTVCAKWHLSGLVFAAGDTQKPSGSGSAQTALGSPASARGLSS